MGLTEQYCITYDSDEQEEYPSNDKQACYRCCEYAFEELIHSLAPG